MHSVRSVFGRRKKSEEKPSLLNLRKEKGKQHASELNCLKGYAQQPANFLLKKYACSYIKATAMSGSVPDTWIFFRCLPPWFVTVLSLHAVQALVARVALVVRKQCRIK